MARREGRLEQLEQALPLALGSGGPRRPRLVASPSLLSSFSSSSFQRVSCAAIGRPAMRPRGFRVEPLRLPVRPHPVRASRCVGRPVSGLVALASSRRLVALGPRARPLSSARVCDAPSGLPRRGEQLERISTTSSCRTCMRAPAGKKSRRRTMIYARAASLVGGGHRPLMASRSPSAPGRCRALSAPLGFAVASPSATARSAHPEANEKRPRRGGGSSRCWACRSTRAPPEAQLRPSGPLWPSR